MSRASLARNSNVSSNPSQSAAKPFRAWRSHRSTPIRVARYPMQRANPACGYDRRGHEHVERAQSRSRADPRRGAGICGAAGCGGRSTDARSRRDLVDLFLERIERPDPRLSAFRVALADQARPRPTGRRRASTRENAPPARRPGRDQGRVRRRGQLNTRGCAPPDQVAATDSEVVRRLRAAGEGGAGLDRRTSLELTIWPFTETESWGKTANPWDANRTPGGSSGGSAAAAAAGLQPSPSARTVPIDSHPSRVVRPLRHQAAARPVSYRPLPEHWHGMSVPGSLARTVLDAALFLDATAGPAPGCRRPARAGGTVRAGRAA